MDISFSILGWFNLDDQVNSWNVQTTRGNISSDKHTAFAGLELFQGNLTLSLSNLTVDDFNVFGDLIRELDLVCFLLLAAEDDGLSTSVASEDVSKSSFTILIRAIDSEMLDMLSCLFLQIFHEI